MIVKCYSKDCLHREDNLCTLAEITLDETELYTVSCLSYKDYTDGPDYQEDYWIACGDSERSDEKYRIHRTGKRIKKCGMVFFTEDDDRIPFDCSITEARTGYRAGMLSEIESRIEEAKERTKDLPDVMSLPIGPNIPQTLLAEGKGR